jgi:phosphate starvation-inducible PhoH-like protein
VTDTHNFPLLLEFSDNSLLQILFGPHHAHLHHIEKQMKVSFYTRGNEITIIGNEQSCYKAHSVLRYLYEKIEKGLSITQAEIDASIRIELEGGQSLLPPVISTRKRKIEARSVAQADYMRLMDRHELVFGIGPAGTGKTYLAVAKAVSMMMKGEVDRIILSRPAVEAGERLGFLPGDLKDKVDPYLRPLYDALNDMLPAEQVTKQLLSGDIEVAPLAFMRGRTLTNAYIILDEAQNTTPVQMKMFLTRLGEGSRMIITGDPSQLDLPPGVRSGLNDAVDILDNIPEIGITRFSTKDVVRHGLVARIIHAYERKEKALFSHSEREKE